MHRLSAHRTFHNISRLHCPFRLSGRTPILIARHATTNASIHQNTQQKHKGRTIIWIGIATAVIIVGTFTVPLIIIADRATRPSRYRLLASTPDKGLTRLWSKDMTLQDRETRFGNSPLYPLFTRLYGDMCHDPLVDFGASFSDVSFTSSDEEHFTLRGWYVPGTSHSTRNKTTIVLCHGAFTDRREMLRHCQYLYNAGYNCMLFDFRDHGISDNSEHRGTSLGIREHRDIIDAVAFVKNKQAQNAEKVVVMGSSTGAVSALMAAVEDPKIDAVIAENPFSHRRKQVREALMTAFNQGRWGGESVKGNTSGLTAIFTKIKVPDWYISLAAWVLDYKAVMSAGFTRTNMYNVIDRVDAISPRPLFLLHGTHDTMVTISHSEQLFEHAKEPKQFWSVDKGRHSMLYQVDPASYQSRILDFIHEYFDQ
jgi:alpha-beta hydrolase superfamily lysophospholipase